MVAVPSFEGPIRRLLLVISALAGAVMSGCLVDDRAVETFDLGSVNEPLFTDETGSIWGVVYSLEFLPIQDAAIHLEPGGAIGRSGADGSYAFNFLAPGTYRISVDVQPFEPQEKEFQIGAGKVATGYFILVEALEARPHRSTTHHDAFIACGVGLAVYTTACGATDPNQVTEFPVPMDARVTGFVASARWDPVATTGSQDGQAWLLFELLDPEGAIAERWISPPDQMTHEIAWPEQAPAAGNWTLTVKPSDGDLGQMFQGNGGVVFDQRVELVVTVAFNGATFEEGYTGFEA